VNEPKKIVVLRQPEPPADEGRMIVTMTAAELRRLIQEEIKAALAEYFHSGDDIAVFFSRELSDLGQVTPDDLRPRYADKQATVRGWIRDRIDKPRKD